MLYKNMYIKEHLILWFEMEGKTYKVATIKNIFIYKYV